MRTTRDAIRTIGHEMRGTLSTIMMWEQVLRLSHDPEVRVRALDAIRDSALAQEQLLEQQLAAVQTLLAESAADH